MARVHGDTEDGLRRDGAQDGTAEKSELVLEKHGSLHVSIFENCTVKALSPAMRRQEALFITSPHPTQGI
jgi:hypothetical protein